MHIAKYKTKKINTQLHVLCSKGRNIDVQVCRLRDSFVFGSFIILLLAFLVWDRSQRLDKQLQKTILVFFFFTLERGSKIDL